MRWSAPVPGEPDNLSYFIEGGPSMRDKPRGAATYGIDVGKNRFHIVGVDSTGKVVQRLTLTRDSIFTFFANATPALIGMEACPGSQWLARKLQTLGHTVRIIPAQFVRPYLKSNKNDTLDAEAIAEAVTRPTMRFVPIKQTEQFDIQAIHRVRDRLVASRSRLTCQMRAFCLECGIALRQGAGLFKIDMPRVLADDANELTPALRRLLTDLWSELKDIEARLASITRQIKALADQNETARRLASIPGIGPLTATALLAAVGDGRQFKTARDLAAWLGLVPRQYTTGGRPTLLGISKRGNSYLRRLLVHGARSCVLHLDRSHDRLGVWVGQLSGRMHFNKVVVAVANKLARIAWAVLTRSGALYERVDPAFAA
jgi:transposase